MTVKELREQLRNMDGNLDVLVEPVFGFRIGHKTEQDDRNAKWNEERSKLRRWPREEFHPSHKVHSVSGYTADWQCGYCTATDDEARITDPCPKAR